MVSARKTLGKCGESGIAAHLGKVMKNVIGIALILTGIVCGVYAGVWWAFIGGIVNVIEAVRAEELVASHVAVGVGKVVFAGVIGWASAVVFALPGAAMIQSGIIPKSRK